MKHFIGTINAALDHETMTTSSYLQANLYVSLELPAKVNSSRSL